MNEVPDLKPIHTKKQTCNYILGTYRHTYCRRRISGYMLANSNIPYQSLPTTIPSHANLPYLPIPNQTHRQKTTVENLRLRKYPTHTTEGKFRTSIPYSEHCGSISLLLKYFLGRVALHHAPATSREDCTWRRSVSKFTVSARAGRGICYLKFATTEDVAA